MSETLDLLCELVRRGREGEAAVQAAVAARMERLGCIVDTLDYRPAEVALREEFAAVSAMASAERTAVVARVPGTGGGRSCILFAHPDSEPVPADHGWRFDPFAARLVGGRLHGWGVADDLAGVSAMVSGLELALADDWRPRGDIVVASAPSKRHARGVATVLERIPTPDAAIYLHPAESGAGMGEIKACTPGLLEFRIDLEGRLPDTAEPGHAAFAHRGLNAVQAATAIVQSVLALDVERGKRVRHARIEGFVGQASNVLISSVRIGADASRNRMPVRGVVEGSVSFPPGERLEAVMDDIARAVTSAELPEGWPHELKPKLSFPAGVAGAETPAEHPLFRTVDDAIWAETGRPAFVNPVHTASDIRVPIVQRGIPTVGLGPLGGDLTQNGRTEEWIDAQDHERCVRVVASALRKWCG
jgi:acetylornithine deacetylase/succinyl-diaminopimelate desuccinylase-like protein